jgi:hypothetical protein
MCHNRPPIQTVREENVRVRMSETECALNSGTSPTDKSEQPAAVNTEEITYHAVEKDGVVTAIWEMQGRKHLRTIDPRSRQGQDILRLYTTEHHDEGASAGSDVATSS